MTEMMTLEEYLTDHGNVSMEKALAAQRFPLWKRSCDTIDDVTFLRHGLFRCMSPVHSGRHYLQVVDEIIGETICH